MAVISQINRQQRRARSTGVARAPSRGGRARLSGATASAGPGQHTARRYSLSRSTVEHARAAAAALSHSQRGGEQRLAGRAQIEST